MMVITIDHSESPRCFSSPVTYIISIERTCNIPYGIPLITSNIIARVSPMGIGKAVVSIRVTNGICSCYTTQENTP